MNLYKVTCVYARTYSQETLDVYVVASSPTKAEQAALNLMKKLQYKFDDRVDTIELVASVNTYRAEHLLVIAD